MTCSATTPASSSPPSPPKLEDYVVYESTPWTSTRSLKQFSIFALGGACFLASTAITRRAVYKRTLRAKPKFYTPNTNPHEHFSPFHDALQALNLATINCLAVGLTLYGGALWAVDLSGIGEMRTNLRKRLDYDAIYAEDTEEEEDDDEEETLEASIIRKRQEAGESKGPKSPR